jgi:hypothetical protein
MISNLIRKPSYVCSICAQDFTRKYNANRHNQNIHFGKAEIVRFVEYLVGRVSGKYQPGDPLLYRNKNRKNSGRSTVVHQNEYGDPLCVNGKSRPSAWNTSTYAAQSTEGVISGNNAKVGNSIGNVNNNNNNNPILSMYNLFQYADNAAKEFLQKQKIERNLKDIERMLQDFYPPHYVQSIIMDLNNRFNSTKDYGGFNTKLEDFRSSIEDVYSGLADRPKWNILL